MNDNMSSNKSNTYTIISSFIPGLFLFVSFILDFLIGIPIRLTIKNAFNFSCGYPCDYPLILVALLLSPIISMINIFVLNTDAKKENIFLCTFLPLISVICGLLLIFLLLFFLLCYALFIKHALI